MEKRLNMQNRFLIFVRLVRPKEAFQAISSMARHQVNMRVWDVLADTVVDGDKRSLCL
jgi:hypothetical protein